MATPPDALSNPAVTAAIGAAIGVVGGGVVGYLLGRHWRTEDRLMTHSTKLKDGALMPWSRASILHAGDGMRRAEEFPRFYEPGLYSNPENLLTTPTFKWAASHIESAYPRIWAAWEEFLVALEEEHAAAARARDTIGAKVEMEFMSRFGGRLESLRGWNLGKAKDVFFEDHVIAAVFQEAVELLRYLALETEPRIQEKLLNCVRADPNAPPGRGYRINYIGIQIGHVIRSEDADTKLWVDVLVSAISDETTQTRVAKALELDEPLKEKLSVFQDELKEVIESIDNGVPIRGACELGF